MATAPGTGPKPPIVLVHGLWMTPKSWTGWRDRFTEAGHRVEAPAWPGVTDDVEAMRADPSALNGLSVTTIVDHYARFIDGLVAETGTQPIIIGHSVGGLIVQLLLDRGYGAAGVAVDAVGPAGVFALPLSQIRAAFPVLGKPWTINGTVMLSPSEFHYAFTNTISRAESDRVRAELAIPGPGKPLWQAATHMLLRSGPTAVDFAKPDRAPLLFIAGGADHIVPPAVNRASAKAYKSGVVEIREFAGRTHNIVGQAGWEEVADAALTWATEHSE